MHIDVVPARFEDKSVVANLVQLYMYDVSEVTGWAIGEYGLYPYRYLDHYWTEPDRRSLLLRVDGELAGFALVRTHIEDDRRTSSMAEFFVLRKFRRTGVGEAAARQIFDLFPGRWVVAQVDGNLTALRFWRTVIGRCTGGSYTERRDDAGRLVQEFTMERAAD